MQIDKAYIEEFDVIRRYHQNKLSDDELNSFEIYILENPDIINVIEKEKVIHDAFRENEPLLKGDAENSETTVDTGSKANGPWGRGFAMAACLLVAILAVFNFSGRQTQYELQSPVRLETFRGAGDMIVQVRGQPIVQFQIDMGPAELIPGNVFTAELIDVAGNTRFREVGLNADADGWLYFILAEQDEILSGRFEVKVYPDGELNLASSYLVEFTSP